MSNQPRHAPVLLRLCGAFAILSLVWSAASCAVTGQARPLLPLFPSPTAVETVIEGGAVEVTFQELNEDPTAFRNRRILVSGSMTPIEPVECPQHNGHYTGPPIRWALVSDNLQMDARGFEPAIALVRPGTTMTVEGIWRLYRGPLGCGKEPERGTSWYLETLRIVEPLALFIPAGPGVPVAGTPVEPATIIEVSPTPGGPTSPSPETTPDAAVTTTATIGTPLPGTATPTGTALATPTLPATGEGTAAPSPTAQGTIPNTPGGTRTGTPGTPTPTYTAEPPGGATGTPDDYPGPGQTPTATTDPYP
jgi:hypothetical protein